MNMDERISKGNCNKDAVAAFRLTKFITWPLGVWPLRCDDLFSRIRFYVCVIFQVIFHCFNHSLLTLDQMMVMISNCGDFDYFIDEMISEICSIMGVLKAVTLRIYSDDIYNILTAALNKCFSIKDDESSKVLKPFMKVGCSITYVQLIMCHFTVIIFLIRPLNELLFNFISQINNNLDRGHFAVLKHDIMKINANLKATSNWEEEIYSIVQRHSELLDLADTLNKRISEVLLVEILLNCLVNLILGMRILIAMKLGQNIIRVILSFTVLMLQVFLLNYAGETLTTQTEAIRDCLCAINWYEFPPKIQKDIYFMIMRAHKPIYRLAGRFYVLNYENFKNILKTCFSLFNIFRLM
ncbi:PREDICTED: odorant receptor 9a-like, partial [Ceratosolen solmsi marchali]|uniref:Odorant receptor n=1 Tax=Ceratosolen solmsi marchali TaxID=326594 RepID=A0AAJ6YIY1_9HYME